jgi:hypothetical protein
LVFVGFFVRRERGVDRDEWQERWPEKQPAGACTIVVARSGGAAANEEIHQ